MAKMPKSAAGFIFRPWIRLKDGTIVYAKSYGKKAFKIPVGDKGEKPGS